jgi:type IV pilus assembly protein PilA
MRERLIGDESGMTLVELLVTITIIGILLAVAVPSYLGYEAKATVATAKSNLRAAIPAVEAYYHDNGTYDATAMTFAELRTYDQGMSPEITVVSGSDTTYCIRSTHAGVSYYKNGPGSTVTTAACT